MNWITKDEVKAAAKAGEMEALKMSLKHHRQGRDCKQWELMQALEEETYSVDAELCGCCMLYKNPTNKMACVDDCPLYKKTGVCCGCLWDNVRDALNYFRDNPTPANFRTFQEAEGKVCEYIQGVIDEKKALSAKKDRMCKTCKHDTEEAEKYCKNFNMAPFECSGWEDKKSKPKLRHGDYGRNPGGMWLHVEGSTYWNCSGNQHKSGLNDNEFIEYRTGNVFDDIRIKNDTSK